jgi:transposase-like protein
VISYRFWSQVTLRGRILTKEERDQMTETDGNGSERVGGEAGGEGARKRRKLLPEDRFRIFLEASRGDVPVASVLRKWGIYSSDLTRIRELVMKGSLEYLARGNGKAKEDPRIGQLRGEKARVEEALKELAIENTLLRKKVD